MVNDGIHHELLLIAISILVSEWSMMLLTQPQSLSKGEANPKQSRCANSIQKTTATIVTAENTQQPQAKVTTKQQQEQLSATAI